MSVFFGLHVGSTSACLAVHREGRLDVVANDAGDRVTPATVGWNGGEVLVGASAEQFFARNPASVVMRNKRILALAAEDPNAAEVDEAIACSGPPTGAKLVRSGGKLVYHVDGGQNDPNVKVSPSSVQTYIYRYLLDIAASHATEDVEATNAVVTVPHGYTKSQREAVRRCARSAGFNVAQVVSEPAASCLAYSLGQLDQTECLKCVVYRCGGSSLDVSVVAVNGGMVSVLRSRSFATGGDAITDVLADYLASEFQRKHKVDPRDSKRAVSKLRASAESVKHVLSTLDTANCYIESLHDGVDFGLTVTRARFENELGKVLAGLLGPVRETLAEAGVKAADVDRVVLCGGTAKVPKIKAGISNAFPRAEVLSSLSPDEVLALGAATQASLLNDPWNPEEEESDEASPTLTATAAAIVFVTGSDAEPTVLIPGGFPVPTRRSHHVAADSSDQVSVKLSLKFAEKSHQLLELSLDKLSNDSKLSVSAHIHRDGGVHFALVDKQSGRCDQATLQAPEA